MLHGRSGSFGFRRGIADCGDDGFNCFLNTLLIGCGDLLICALDRESVVILNDVDAMYFHSGYLMLRLSLRLVQPQDLPKVALYQIL